MKMKLIVLITLVSLLISPTLSLAQQVAGKIVAVNEAKEVILLKSRGEIKGYQLSLGAEVKLNQKNVDLTALRPVDYKSFCAAELSLDQAGRVTEINAAYEAFEVVVTELSERGIVVKKVETGTRYEFEITKGVKIIRNNLSSRQKDIKRGDKGLVILGLNEQLEGIILSHYQRYGFIKKIDQQRGEILLNTGTRLRPSCETLVITEETELRLEEEEIELKELSPGLWIKVEAIKPVKKLRARKI